MRFRGHNSRAPKAWYLSGKLLSKQQRIRADFAACDAPPPPHADEPSEPQLKLNPPPFALPIFFPFKSIVK